MLVLFHPRISGRRGHEHTRCSLWFRTPLIINPEAYCVGGFCMHHTDTCMLQRHFAP